MTTDPELSERPAPPRRRRGTKQRMDLAERYRIYADYVQPRSSTVADLARVMADDPEVMRLLDTLQAHNRRPSMVFAVLRKTYGQLDDWPALRAAFLADPVPALKEIRTRLVNMTEPQRLAMLIPILASLPGPLALIDVGASLGLCLLPDYYTYRYPGKTLHGKQVDGLPTPAFDCWATQAVPIPDGLPEIAWRAGIDLRPQDVGDDDTVSWFEQFIWPEETARLERFRECVAVARAVRPKVVPGDMLRSIPYVLEHVPEGLTTVVMNCGTARYLVVPDREVFADAVQSLPVHWVSAESSRVFPRIAAQVPSVDRRAEFLLSLDGRPLGWGSLLGDWVQWFPPGSVPGVG